MNSVAWYCTGTFCNWSRRTAARVSRVVLSSRITSVISLRNAVRVNTGDGSLTEGAGARSALGVGGTVGAVQGLELFRGDCVFLGDMAAFGGCTAGALRRLRDPFGLLVTEASTFSTTAVFASAARITFSTSLAGTKKVPPLLLLCSFPSFLVSHKSLRSFNAFSLPLRPFFGVLVEPPV